MSPPNPQPARPAGYHAGLNRHLASAVPDDALRLLEVGCGTGRLGAALRAEVPGRVVFGAERDRDAAAVAAQQLDRVFTLDVEREEVPLPRGSLDALLYGDVLEHFTDPLGVLLRHRQLLRPGGLLLCCLPNVQHHSVLTALLSGDWQYQASGLLDREHFRFFSYSTALKLLLDAGFVPRIADTIRVPMADSLARALLPLLEHLGLHSERTRGYLEGYQYVLRGDLLPDALDDDESDQEPLTFAACVSDEATLRANLLASPCLQPGTPHQVLLFRGCGSAAEGLNAALSVGQHRVVVCLHQDVYLPRGWVKRFWRSWRQAEAEFGRVGVAGVYGASLRGGAVKRAGRVVDRDRLLREAPDLPAPVDTLDELLLAVPRDSGLRLDAELGFHLYGADLCLRARRAGFRLLVAQDTYIHHFGSTTFRALGVDCRGQLEGNLALYRQKWGEEEASRYRPMGDSPAPRPTAVVSADSTRRATVSCCVITKNEEGNIADCLRCVRDLVDEVVVTDTGSTDRTKAIAAEMGARVFDFAWQDSFSAARNACIAQATGQWIFWVDADDRIDEENRQKLKALFASLGHENRGFVMNCFCVPDEASSTGTTVTHVRLFRNLPEVRWEHRIHEQILPALRRIGAEVVYTDAVIRHTGYVDPALRGSKRERDLRLLRLEEAELPEHPFTLFNLAMTTLDLGRFDAAEAYARRSLALSHPSDSIVRKLYAMLAQCLWGQGLPRDALAHIGEGRQHYPDDEELLWLEGRYREDLGDLEGAERAFRRLVEGREEAHLSSVRDGLRTVLGREVLGRVCFRLGRLDAAEAQWAAVAAEAPGWLPAWAGLADVCLAQQRWEQAERALRRVLELDAGHAGARANLQAVLRNLGR